MRTSTVEGGELKLKKLVASRTSLLGVTAIPKTSAWVAKVLTIVLLLVSIDATVLLKSGSSTRRNLPSAVNTRSCGELIATVPVTTGG